MESLSLPTPPKELRIETSSTILTPIDPDVDPELPAVEAAQLSPKVDRVRHHLIPARTTTCVRAPCLKRQASVPISSITTNLAASRLEAAPIQDRVASNPLPTSFAAPRNFVLQHSPRHVHFDDSPPEEFFVLSGESYDRRPIKCTQGGSEFDMSLPPRCSSYNGDDANDEDASSTNDGPTAMESAEEPAPDVGFFRDPSLENWACIKNGTDTAAIGYQPRQQQSGLMASGRSLHFSALSSLQQASALDLADAPTDSPRSQSPVSSQKVSLPVHGFRSFGGLQNSLAPEVTTVQSAPSESKISSSKQALSSPETTPPALRNFSPDATPMPSPSLHKSIGALSSVNYFAVGSDAAQQPTPKASFSDAAPALETSQGAMEVLRDPSPPTETPSKATDDFRTAQHALTANGLGSPKPAKPAPITVNVADASAQSTPRRLGLERRMAEKDAIRISSLANGASSSISTSSSSTSTSSSGWSSLLGVTSSPLSSRCSSVDPWSSLSSDGDCDGTESPGNENSWISSNCTSPDLSPFEQMVEGFHHQKAGSNNSSGSGAGAQQRDNPLAQQVNGASKLGRMSVNEVDDMDHDLITPKNTDFADETKFSSSVETVHTVNWEQKHVPVHASAGLFSGLSSGDISTSEATTPDSSRHPSFHHQEMPPHRMSPRLRTSFGERESAIADHLDEDDSHRLRVRSLSRDGHAKKKSSKCRFCRSLRQRIKASGTDSSAPTSSTGSAQITDAESEMVAESKASTPSHMQNGFGHHRDLTSSAEVSEMEEDDGSRSRSSISQLRASVRSMSVDEWSTDTSRSRSRDGSVLSHLAIASDALHERESSNSPGESCSESPHLSAVNLPTMCTCDKKKEKERMKKKIRKERELERERDREWERDQARGRQKKLFGESFGDADNSCLSALDGF